MGVPLLSLLWSETPKVSLRAHYAPTSVSSSLSGMSVIVYLGERAPRENAMLSACVPPHSGFPKGTMGLFYTAAQNPPPLEKPQLYQWGKNNLQTFFNANK